MLYVWYSSFISLEFKTHTHTQVRAALLGRVLILDGLEKAERNVLPALNNLLENREMQLEDGRFLVSPSRYDSLLSTHGKDRLLEWNLVRCHKDFRVLALTLPVPPHFGTWCSMVFDGVRVRSARIPITTYSFATNIQVLRWILRYVLVSRLWVSSGVRALPL